MIIKPTLFQLSGIVIDLVHRVSQIPQPGAEAEAHERLITPGGGYNAMIAAKRFGMSVAYAGALGTGIFADIVKDALGKEGIPILAATRSPLDQGTCAVIIDDSGERTFYTHHGAERNPGPRDLAALSPSSSDWLLLSGYSLLKETSAAAFVPWLRTFRRGPVFVFDPAPVVGDIPDANLQPALARANWISANRREAQTLSGATTPEAAAQMLAQGRAGAIVRDGADGCWLSTNGATVKVDGFRVAALDSSGAGDAHIGAFIAAMGLGFDTLAAAQLANAAAAIKTTRFGPATSPGLEETLAFLHDRDVRLRTPPALTEAGIETVAGPQHSGRN